MSVTAQDFSNQPIQRQGSTPQNEMAPPPPGPYLVDPGPKSTNIYDDMRETESYQQQPDVYSGYVAPQYPAGQMPGSYYEQGYYPPPPAPGGAYQPYAQPYGNAYPPSYPGYAPHWQPRYMNPYGQQQ